MTQEQIDWTVASVIRLACIYFNVTSIAIQSKWRGVYNVADARHCTQTIIRELTPLSLTEIGKKTGGRSHSTVLQGIKSFKGKMEFDKILQSKYNAIKHKTDTTYLADILINIESIPQL